jgi:hypothetical protein
LQDSEFELIGKRLAAEGLVSANFGNMSIRSGKDFLITRSGSFLDQPGHPVAVPIREEVSPEASSEYRIHHETYIETKHQAIVHAHPLTLSPCPWCLMSVSPGTARERCSVRSFLSFPEGRGARSSLIRSPGRLPEPDS